MAEDRKRRLKSEQYRVFATDTFAVRVSNHSGQINFLIEALDEEDKASIVLEATANLSITSFKILQLVISNAIEAIESEIGPIPLPPGKAEQLKKIMQAVRDQRAQKKEAAAKKEQPPPDR